MDLLATLQQPISFSSSASPTLSAQNSAPGSNAAPSASAGLSAGCKDTTNAQKAIDRAQLAEMMSHFLNGQAPGPGGGGALDVGSTPAHFLPMLQSVCGQVTQLRLDDAAAAAERNTVATWLGYESEAREEG
ncbi:hypothetical protein CRUP_027984 [Coryphaenoides rupestris]|nr:hypothetical protein CRUP_027984 [Coryphaenoides rupestris]